MDQKKNNNNNQDAQEIYAKYLRMLTRSGLIFLFGTFIIYITQAIPSYVPLANLPNYLKMRVTDYIEISGTPTGWDWLNLLNYSDILAFSSIVFLSTISIMTYIIILPYFIRKKNTLYTIIVLIQLVVFIAATINPGPGH